MRVHSNLARKRVMNWRTCHSFHAFLLVRQRHLSSVFSILFDLLLDLNVGSRLEARNRISLTWRISLFSSSSDWPFKLSSGLVAMDTAS